MRILSMADVPPDLDSGAAGTVLRLAEALRGLGHEVDTVWASELRRRIAHGNLHYLLELPVTYRSVLRRRLEEKPYDVVQASQPHGWLAARMLRRTERGPFFVHLSHGLEPRRAEALRRWEGVYPREGGDRGATRRALGRGLAGLLRWNDRAIARYAGGHLVGCGECLEYLRDEMGVPEARIAVIGRGVSETMRRTPRRAMDPERLAGVLYVGQFVYIKAPMVVARVMNRLAARRDDLRFTWVASVKDHRRIRSLLDERTRPRVRLLDWMPRDDLVTIFDEHGIFLFPSFFEGFGKAFLEAMSRGLCVVAANNGGARDVVTDRRDGRLVETGDADAMVEACEELLADPALAARVSAAAVGTADDHAWSAVAEKAVAFYRRWIPAPGPIS